MRLRLEHENRRSQVIPPSLLLCLSLLVFYTFARRATLAEREMERRTRGGEVSLSTGIVSMTAEDVELIKRVAAGEDEAIAEARAELVDETQALAQDVNTKEMIAELRSETEGAGDDLTGNNGGGAIRGGNRDATNGDVESRSEEDDGSTSSDDGDDHQVATVRRSYVDPNNLVIAGLGDVLLLSFLANEARREGNFSHFWTPLERYWKERSHYTFANFEGTAGPVDKKGRLVKGGAKRDDANVYTTGITTGGFNYHESIAKELVESGINVLTTANNHAFDRGTQGLTTTAEILQKAGAIQIGSLLGSGDPTKAYLHRGWYRVTTMSEVEDGDAKDLGAMESESTDENTAGPRNRKWRVAWVGCTTILCAECRESLKIPQSEVERRVLFCDKAPALVNRLYKREDIDLVVVGAHWGAQFVDQFAPRTQELAKQLLEAGAAAVFGNHPHIMQGAEHYKTRDGRNTYVAYSIGSLTSGLGSSPKMWKRRTSVVLFIEFQRRRLLPRTDKRSKRRSSENLDSDNAEKPRWVAEVKTVRYFPICEITRLTPKGKLHIMKLTEEVNKLNDGECANEEKWARRLLGEADFRRLNEIPYVRFGSDSGDDFARRRQWREVLMDIPPPTKEERESGGEIEKKVEAWRRGG